jgi:uncharacterized membrane protein
MDRARSYGVALVTLLALDLVWLGSVAPPLYRATIGPLLRERPDLMAAALFYALYVVGVVEFAVRPQPSGAAAVRVAGRGALLGLFAYGTFDLTAQAVLAGWSPLIVVVDMAWGALITGAVATVTHRLTRGADRAAGGPGAPPPA